MKITQIFEFTEEEKEHFTFVIKFLRELDGDENIKERLSDYYFCGNVADLLSGFIEEIEGENFYTIDTPDR